MSMFTQCSTNMKPFSHRHSLIAANNKDLRKRSVHTNTSLTWNPIIMISFILIPHWNWYQENDYFSLLLIWITINRNRKQRNPIITKKINVEPLLLNHWLRSTLNAQWLKVNELYFLYYWAIGCCCPCLWLSSQFTCSSATLWESPQHLVLAFVPQPQVLLNSWLSHTSNTWINLRLVWLKPEFNTDGNKREKSETQS